MALGNVRINGVALNPQPSKFNPKAPAPALQRAINGMHVPSTPQFGWIFELTWGNESITDKESFIEATSRLGSAGSVMDITWEDGNGDDQTKTVALIEEISPSMRWGTNLEVFNVVLYEVDETMVGS